MAVDLMAQRCADLFHHGPFESLPTAGEGRVSKGPSLLSAGKPPLSAQKRKLCTGKHSEANTSGSRCNCSNRRWCLVAAAITVVACLAPTRANAAGSFYEDFEVVWGEDPHPERRVAVIDGGRLVKLTLDNVSGSGFQSKDAFLFGEFTMQMKLVPGDSAGTVTTFYLSSKDYPMWEGDGHDEIDFEFLGNVSGEPYLMQTNVYAQGVGRREQRFFLWFDPTADFHNYTILWNPLNIIFSVDGTPVRVFKNHELQGVPYLSRQAMKVRASIWDGESWVTMGGRVKTDWSHAPFVASYGAYDASTACVSSAASASSSCSPAPWMARRLGPKGERALTWARENYMVMDYCDDPWKVFPRGVPAECGIDRLAAGHVQPPLILRFYVHLRGYCKLNFSRL